MEQLRAEIKKESVTEPKRAYGSNGESSSHSSSRKRGEENDDSDYSEPSNGDRKRSLAGRRPPDSDEPSDGDDREWRQRIDKKRIGSILINNVYMEKAAAEMCFGFVKYEVQHFSLGTDLTIKN